MRKSKRHNFLNIANPSSFFLCVFTQSEFPVRISYRVEPRDESEAAMWTNTIWPPPEFYSRPSIRVTERKLFWLCFIYVIELTTVVHGMHLILLRYKQA